MNTLARTILRPIFKKSLCVLAATGIFVGSTVAATPSITLEPAGDDRYRSRGDHRDGGRKSRGGRGYNKGYKQGRRDQRRKHKRSRSYSRYSYGSYYPTYGYNYGYNYGYPTYSYGYSGRGNSGLGLGLGIVGAAAILSASSNKKARRREAERERRYEREKAERDATREADRAYDQGRRDAEQGSSGNTNNNQGDPEFGGNCVQKREYQTTIKIGGEEKDAYGTTCLRADGTWEMGNPKLSQ